MIGVDWGTSNLRAYRISPDGRVLERREAPRGILTVEAGRFAEALEAEIGDWLDAGEAPLLLSGMIGSRQGWVEVPYATCPAGLDELASGLREVRWGNGRRARVAPGLTCRDRSGTPDVMRGEEVQLLGALEVLAGGPHLVCLPGTHSKWATVLEGRIERFSTYMTGETYALLRSHSILARLMAEGEGDLLWFDEGVRRAKDAGGLLHHLFGVRSRGLLGEIPAAALAHYLSGLLIGHELSAAASGAAAVHLLGSPRLVDLYARALRIAGHGSRALDPDAVASGLFRLASYVPRQGG